MDPVVLVALIGLASGLLSIWLTRRLERGKDANEQAATKVSETAVVVAAWKDLLAAKERELVHKEQQLAEEQAIAASFSAKADRLEAENRELRDQRDRCQAEHTQET